MKKWISLYFLLVVFTSCVSTKKYNEQVTRLHSPKELKKDIDYAYKKLKKFHPDLYWYISEDSLDQIFSSFKESIKDPMTSTEFYTQFTPLIGSIRQGHTRTVAPIVRQTKEEIKSKGKRQHPFKYFEFENINNKLILTKNHGSDSSILEGSQVLSIENENIDDLITAYLPLNIGDGFNETFLPSYTYTEFGSLYLSTHAPKDSLSITLQKNDSLYTSYLHCFPKKKKTKAVADTLKKTREEKKLARKKRREKNIANRKYGSYSYKKERKRDISFLKYNSTDSVAYMKIQSFFGRNYEDYHRECFAQIDSAKSKHLIIDLRYNLGGSALEIENLYSYLTDSEFSFFEKSKMTKSTSSLATWVYSEGIGPKIAALTFSPMLLINQITRVSRKDGVPYYRISKKKKNKRNNYKGKVYVLINGESFSASCILATTLKANKRATFVGEETGGAYNGTVAGQFIRLSLPNTKVRLKFGVMTLKTPYRTSPDGYGIKPDVYIPRTKIGIDEQLDWVLEDIRKSSEI